MKRKRWKKGHSSSSNPESKTHREAAKNRFFQDNIGSSNLTVEALALHDKEEDGDVAMSQVDQASVNSRTVNTWATNWTECTNVTFSKLHRYWASNSALHREVLAVLAAITEVIKTEGGTESDTEYFASLMTALESADNGESLTAIVYLLSIVLKRVPAAVLKSKFSEVAKAFLDLLAKYSDGEETCLVKSLLISLALVLRVQDPASWSNSSTQRIFSSILTFINHKKPKIRKSAHQAVKIVLKGSLFMFQGEHPSHHPAASITSKHCVRLIEECGGSGEAQNTLHTLQLLKDILCTFPQKSIKSTCEVILKVMTLSNVLIRSCGMQALHSLFSAQPQADTLSAEVNAKIIMALYDFQPSVNDVQPTLAWLAVMEKAYINLMRLDRNLCLGHLPRLFSVGMTCLLSERLEVIAGATKSLKVLLRQCLSPATESSSMSSSAQKIIKAIESGLSYQFHASWGHVLQLFEVLFEVLGKYCPDLLKKCVVSVANMRDSHNFAYKGELDHAIGSAVKTMGPKCILEAVPLQITGDCDDYSFPRSWLLPVIRDNVQETELSFFTTYFLPLAAKLRHKSTELAKENNMVVSKTYDALQLQIWSLFPGFCNQPVDLAKSFKGIAKILGTAITESPDLRMSVMSSLRRLIVQCQDNEENKKEIARFAKNFLPIFFNFFTAEPENDKDLTRLAVLETIKCYLQITDKQLVHTFFIKCNEKMKEEKITSFTKHALLDIDMALCPYLNSESLAVLYREATSCLVIPDKTAQKKAYRIMEEILSGKSEESQEFIQKNLVDIQKTLLDSLSISSPSSKAPRLRCLIHLCQQLKERENGFLVAAVPEAIMCTKELAVKARQAAYSLLIELCHTMMKWLPDHDEENIRDFFKLVMAGLAGSPQMISATLLALTRLLIEFKDKVCTNLMESLLENTCKLLTTKAREVVLSALGFLKVVISVFSVITLSAHLKSIISSLISMKEDAKHHFRFRSKAIFSKLIKKFGYETVYNMCPSSIHRMLVNIRKTQERTKKRKKERANEEDEEEDEEEKEYRTRPENIEELLEESDSDLEDDTKKSKSVKKQNEKSGKAWLREDQDDIVDFMAKDAAQKVMATKPSTSKPGAKKSADFKMASDGRLIITNDSDDDGGKMDSEDEDDIDDLLATLEGGGKSKRKKRKLEEMDSDEDKAVPKYKAGGHGIHRPLSHKKLKPVPGREFKAKKAGGDIKKKGKPDPYAYLPLNFQTLNKRKQAKVKGQYKGFVRGAKKGAMKGMKSKKKKR